MEGCLARKTRIKCVAEAIANNYERDQSPVEEAMEDIAPAVRRDPMHSVRRLQRVRGATAPNLTDLAREQRHEMNDDQEHHGCDFVNSRLGVPVSSSAPRNPRNGGKISTGTGGSRPCLCAGTSTNSE